ncbi:MAG TPA: AAA family ATPase [Vicinamibacterales bacterium]|nr:AAA family ATPase [Vicinamibacterales bacterium]
MKPDPSPTERQRWRRAQDLFAAALDLSGAERRQLLDRECADTALRREVESLLASHEGSGALDRLADDVVSPAVAAVRRGPSSAAGRVVSHYTIGEPLGTGGMGIVYRAHDDRLGRTIALKFLPPHLGANEDAKRRFLVEGRAAAALEHPNVCTIYEIGETPEGELFIAMPLYDGETLQARLARGPIPVDAAVALAREVALGLAAAHRLGIVHRDVKPSNVMLLPEGRLKILDFGVAKMPDVTMTGSGTRIGTAAYMSPEQSRGDTVDLRTDVWSLGVVLYEMIAGRRPFDAETPSGLIYAILTNEPPPLSDVRPEVDRRLSEAVARALAKTPARRFASMTEFAAALDGLPRPEAGVRTASTPAVERRHVTLLTSTISDYAGLIEQLDVAELEELVDRFHADAVDVMRQHGGLVNQAIGEEITALFGIPAGHEDDEMRAVRAALDLHARAREISTGGTRRAGLSIALHSGIAAGSTLVQRLREGPRRYHLSGQAVQAALRLGATAARDTIAIGPDAHRRVAPFVASDPLPAIELTPGARPVTPYRVLGLQTRVESERDDLTPYIGRTAELRQLESVVARACAGEGRLVSIVGEAGMGKSRLLHELRRRVSDSGVTVLQGRCQSYGGLSPYLPFVQLLGDALGIDPGRRPPGDEVAARIVALDSSLETFVAVYLHLLSLESERIELPRHLRGDHLHTVLLDAVTAIVMVLARRSALLLLLEDWHWADEASRDVVRRLAEIVDSCALALVVTSRPEGAGLSELSGRTDVVRLEPLDPEGASQILRAVFQARHVSADLATRVYERTGGNPFFIEQVAHTLVEEGAIRTVGDVAELHRDVETLRLPDTIQAVIRARLDRLGPDALEVLRVASVIGREFDRALLVTALDSSLDVEHALDRLRASGLIQQTRVVPQPAHRFKHVLTQEVAYGSLLGHQRRTLHSVIGHALEQAMGPRSPEVAETLAHHFSAAEEWIGAIRYGRHAVERLRALSQHGDAQALVERVLQWVPHLPDDDGRRDVTADLLLEQERLCETLGQRGRQQQIIADLIALLAPRGSSPRLAEAYLRQGDLLTILKRFDAANRALGTALRLSREQADIALERNVLRSMGLLRWFEGRLPDALDMAEKALAIDRERRDDVATAADLANVGILLRTMGEYERGLAALEEALALPVLEHDPVRRAYVLHNLANLHRCLGNVDRAMSYLQRANTVVDVDMVPIQRSFHLNAIAHIQLQLGEVDEALHTYSEAVACSRRVRHANGLAQALRTLGELELGLSREGDAIAHLSEAVPLFAQLEDREAEVETRTHLGRLHERRAEWDAAVRHWTAVRELARAAGDRPGELAAVEGIARATRGCGAPAADVRTRFGELLALAVSLGDGEREAAAHNTLGILAWTEERYAEALDHYETGLRLCRQTGQRSNEGLMLNSVGVTLSRLQRDDEARTVLEESVLLNRGIGERLLEAHALAALGDVSLRLGHAREACDSFERARDLRRELKDPAGEAMMEQRLAGARAGLTNQKEG